MLVLIKQPNLIQLISLNMKWKYLFIFVTTRITAWVAKEK